MSYQTHPHPHPHPHTLTLTPHPHPHTLTPSPSPSPSHPHSHPHPSPGFVLVSCWSTGDHHHKRTSQKNKEHHMRIQWNPALYLGHPWDQNSCLCQQVSPSLPSDRNKVKNECCEPRLLQSGLLSTAASEAAPSLVHR